MNYFYDNWFFNIYSNFRYYIDKIDLFYQQIYFVVLMLLIISVYIVIKIIKNKKLKGVNLLFSINIFIWLCYLIKYYFTGTIFEYNLSDIIFTIVVVLNMFLSTLYLGFTSIVLQLIFMTLIYNKNKPKL